LDEFAYKYQVWSQRRLVNQITKRNRQLLHYAAVLHSCESILLKERIQLFLKLASDVGQQYHWYQQQAFTPSRGLI
jgi:hypothetical protein